MHGHHDRPAKAYILCTSPRSGSTLLCKMLSATGRAGNPKSYFHGPDLDDWRRYLRLRDTAGIEQIFAEARVQGRGGTDLFGLRLQRHSFAAFQGALQKLHRQNTGEDGTDDVSRINACFGSAHFIYLTRRDKTAQAVSFEIARQSGLWHRAPDGQEIERLAPPAEPEFDETALRTLMEQFQAYDTAWQGWFASQSITPLTLSYEALAENPHGVLEKALAFLGLDPSLAADAPLPVAKLADARNTDWCARLSSAQRKTRP